MTISRWLNSGHPTPREGGLRWVKFFGSSLLQPEHSVCVSLSTFSLFCAMRYGLKICKTWPHQLLLCCVYCQWFKLHLTTSIKWKKHIERWKHCSNAEPKFLAPPQTPFPGAQDGQNLISWRWSLPSPTDPVWWRSMHAISSYRGNRPTNTGPITIHCAAKLSAQCNEGWLPIKWLQ